MDDIFMLIFIVIELYSFVFYEFKTGKILTVDKWNNALNTKHVCFNFK